MRRAKAASHVAQCGRPSVRRKCTLELAVGRTLLCNSSAIIFPPLSPLPLTSLPKKGDASQPVPPTNKCGGASLWLVDVNRTTPLLFGAPQSRGVVAKVAK